MQNISEFVLYLIKSDIIHSKNVTVYNLSTFYKNLKSGFDD